MGHKDSVWIEVKWDNDILDAFHLQRGQRFVIGDSQGDWPFPRDLLPNGSTLLVDYTAEQPCWCPSGTPLQLGKQAEAHFANIHISVQLETSVQVPDTRRHLTGIDRVFAYFGASATAISALLLGAYYAVPTLTEVDLSSPAPDVILYFNYPGDPPDPDEPEPEPAPTPAANVYLSKHGIVGNSRCGGEVDMGTSRAGSNRYGVEGPRDNPDPHLGRILAPGERSYNGTYEALVSSQEKFTPVDTLAPVAPWGRDDRLGTDEVGARGNMWGDEIGVGTGYEDSLGLAHLDGGEVKAIDAQRPSAAARPARVIHIQGKVQGPLPASAVELALVGKLEALRRCYHADATSTGAREGRIELEFAIDTDGTTIDPKLTQSGEVSPTTVACILDHVREATFAKADSPSKVTYPLLLVPGEVSTPQPVERIDLVPPIAHTNDPAIPCGGTHHSHLKANRNCKR